MKLLFRTCFLALMAIGSTLPLAGCSDDDDDQPPPPPQITSIRVTLSWPNATDHDIVMTGPAASGTGRFLVYFGDRNPSGGNASLDGDAVTAGSETITLTPGGRNGMYRFTAIPNGGLDALRSGPATVRVFYNNNTTPEKTYTAPTTGTGDAWRVLEINVTGTAIALNDNNGASLGIIDLNTADLRAPEDGQTPVSGKAFRARD